MKMSMILGIIAIVIGSLAFSDIACAIDVRKEVEEIVKLENAGNKADAKKKLNELKAEVDRLNKEGKEEEAKKLYNEIWAELFEQSKKNKQKK